MQATPSFASPESSPLGFLRFEDRASKALKAVVVRHPLSRLLSAYRMAFEDWCDEDRFLAKQWKNVCKLDFVAADREAEEGGLNDDDDDVTSLSDLADFVSKAFRQHKEGNDRFILSLWRRYNPGVPLIDPKRQLRLTFAQFADFLVNSSSSTGSSSWSTSTNPLGLSYHWSPFWRECPVCSSVAGPDLVLRMETLRADLDQLLERIGFLGASVLPKFPHTHQQDGGHSSEMELARK